MCGRKTSSNTARSSLFCTIGTDACCWPDIRSGPSDRSFNTTSSSSVRRKSDRRTDKGVVMFGTLRFGPLRLLYDDLSDHVRMQTAEIVERTGASEGKRIGVVGVERLRPKGRLLLDYRMRNVVVIDPLDRGSHSDRQFLGRKGEIVDGDLVYILHRAILRRYRTKRQHRSDDRAQKKRDDQAAVRRKPGCCEAELADQDLHVRSSISRPASCR